MEQLIVECSDPGLVISLAEEFENVLRQIDFARARALQSELGQLARELGHLRQGLRQPLPGLRTSVVVVEGQVEIVTQPICCYNQYLGGKKRACRRDTA